ncbi:hypothetical protein PENSUB_5137 [Penicillium subrubescens]|uniref:Uncharacterized protein n=1 Tax=Penicillium subrubescens TaxID=1316194 RepID=A0A1Q5UAL4_9EURO|nr:hypothetical protein PENSUB_5137 [Penicillium subrubescens]
MEMSKSDCDALSSDVLRKLLEAPPEPGDMQTEREARAQLIQDLTNLEEDISESEGDTQPPRDNLHMLTTTSEWKGSDNSQNYAGARSSL